MKNIMVIGWKRNGKDTVGEMLQEIGYKAISSSVYAAEKVVYPVLSKLYGYNSVEECYEDRHSHRVEWYDLIADYNKDDPARLSREMIEDGYNIYVGLRNADELVEAKKHYDLVVWVDGYGRTGIKEDESSCTVTADMADFIITNNGSLEELRDKVVRIFGVIDDV